MITPIENAADLAEQQDISYGTLEGGSTMTFFRVSFLNVYLLSPSLFFFFTLLYHHSIYITMVLWCFFFFIFACQTLFYVCIHDTYSIGKFLLTIIVGF